MQRTGDDAHGERREFGDLNQDVPGTKTLVTGC